MHDFGRPREKQTCRIAFNRECSRKKWVGGREGVREGERRKGGGGGKGKEIGERGARRDPHNNKKGKNLQAMGVVNVRTPNVARTNNSTRELRMYMSSSKVRETLGSPAAFTK